MKIVLSEYLNLLKEDQELDSLLSDLLISMEIIPITKPKKGAKQHGVDITAVGIDPEDGVKKLFLFAVKRGNLTPSNWDTGKNAVRPTLNEIQDDYLSTNLPIKLKPLPKCIIVATNGGVSQEVNQQWVNYTNNHSIKRELEFKFWGTDEIVSLLEKHLLNEVLFPAEYRSLLRKTLAFLDLPDFDLKHFYLLIEKILSVKGSKKQQLKKMRLVSLCVNMLWTWCEDVGNLKPAIYGAERSLLLTWYWLQSNDLLKEKYALREFEKLHHLKKDINHQFFIKTYEHCSVRDSLYKYSRNSINYTLTAFEYIGILASIGLSEFFDGERHSILKKGDKEFSKTCYTNSLAVAHALMAFIEHNPSSLNPQFDEHCIEVTLCFLLLYKTQQHEFAASMLHKLILYLNDSILFNDFFPLFHTSYDALLETNFDKSAPKISSSFLLTVLAEWSVMLQNPSAYQLLRNLISNRAPEVNLQMWFPEADTEQTYLKEEAMKNTGSIKHSIKLHADMNEYKKEMLFECGHAEYSQEKGFKTFTNGYYYLNFLANRHYRSCVFPYLWRGLM